MSYPVPADGTCEGQECWTATALAQIQVLKAASDVKVAQAEIALSAAEAENMQLQQNLMAAMMSPCC